MHRFAKAKHNGDGDRKALQAGAFLLFALQAFGDSAEERAGKGYFGGAYCLCCACAAMPRISVTKHTICLWCFSPTPSDRPPTMHL